MNFTLIITLISSVIFMGYSISEFTSSYKTICEKTSEFKKMALANNAPEETLRKSNFILSFILSSIFVTLIYMSGLVMWIIVFVALKLFVTLCCSDVTLIHAMRNDGISKKFYMLSKMDALLNAIIGLFVALIVSSII